ncbi:MAG: hypothetical protein QOI06_1494 [Nocardioidaceae bacterium]|nr:hypothetical protein [Nocardioidaceae bacterium]
MSADELEQMRLILSTFRDGSGQVILKASGESMPGFRDFERATAVVCGGTTAEDKGIFDVLIPVSGRLPYGVSCKMAVTQRALTHSSFMEMSNSAKKFADEFQRLGIDWTTQPDLAGRATVDLVSGWHSVLGGEVDLPGSRYLLLSHDRAWRNFQILCYSLNLKHANPRTGVKWRVEGRRTPSSVAGYVRDGVRDHRLWQLYPNSGGQLKYYPLLEWAEWTSPSFTLEQPPVRSLLERVNEYFPGRWPR